MHLFYSCLVQDLLRLAQDKFRFPLLYRWAEMIRGLYFIVPLSLSAPPWIHTLVHFWVLVHFISNIGYCLIYRQVRGLPQGPQPLPLRDGFWK